MHGATIKIHRAYSVISYPVQFLIEVLLSSVMSTISSFFFYVLDPSTSSNSQLIPEAMNTFLI